MTPSNRPDPAPIGQQGATSKAPEGGVGAETPARRPTPRELSEWYADALARLGADELECVDCSSRGFAWRVQPQHPFYNEGREGEARCVDCIAARGREARARRKAELAAMPRCALCRRRGAWRCGSGGDTVLLCGAHKSRAQRAWQRRMARAGGGLALFLPPPMASGATILELAREG